MGILLHTYRTTSKSESAELVCIILYMPSNIFKLLGNHYVEQWVGADNYTATWQINVIDR
jgi:hypothetical protein